MAAKPWDKLIDGQKINAPLFAPGNQGKLTPGDIAKKQAIIT